MVNHALTVACPGSPSPATTRWPASSSTPSTSSRQAALQRRATMNTRMAQTYLQTPTEVISTVEGVDFAYRHMGSGGDLPLVLAGYFASNMDNWDPLIVDGLAAE